MDLLRALTLPFRPASLLFVALTSLFLSVVLSAGGIVGLLALFGLYVTAVVLTRYAFRMIEDAANGVRDAAVVDISMLNPLDDARTFIHPALAVLLLVAHLTWPDWPAVPTLVAVALLFPPSIAATLLDGRARDAFNPVAIGAVIRDLGIWYPLTVLGTAALCALAVLLVRWLQRGWLMMAGLELLLLLIYAWIGGAVYMRRFELGFLARHAPERKAQAAAHERDRRRQHMLDRVYTDLNGREPRRALAHLQQWLAEADPQMLPGDVDEIIAAGRAWDEPRAFPRLLRGLAVLVQQRQQTALALKITETGLALDQAFAPADETAVVAIAGHAMHTGRRRTALRLIDNFLRTLPDGATAGAPLRALRKTLEPLR